MTFRRAMTIGMIWSGVACCVGGCATSEADRTAIIAKLKEYEASHKERTAQDLEDAKITVIFDTARAKYSVQYPNSQFVLPPIQIKLKKRDGRWAIVSETHYSPEWPFQKTKTVKVKSTMRSINSANDWR